MKRPDFRYLVLWLFLFGIVIIVFLQVISGYNIKRLTDGNKRFLGEMQVQNSLRRLETDGLIAESDIRGMVITGNADHIKNFSTSNSNLERELNEIRTGLNGAHYE